MFSTRYYIGFFLRLAARPPRRPSDRPRRVRTRRAPRALCRFSRTASRACSPRPYAVREACAPARRPLGRSARRSRRQLRRRRDHSASQAMASPRPLRVASRGVAANTPRGEPRHRRDRSALLAVVLLRPFRLASRGGVATTRAAARYEPRPRALRVSSRGAAATTPSQAVAATTPRLKRGGTATTPHRMWRRRDHSSWQTASPPPPVSGVAATR